MTSLVPVDNDPFAATPAPQLVPVDHDPFAIVAPAGAPAVAAPQAAASASGGQMPETDAMGNPTGRMIDLGAPSTMSYGDQMGHVAGAIGTSANRIASNLPFADRATAGLMTATGTGNYSDNLAAIRAYNEKQAKENPVGETAATIAGSALLPVGVLGNVARGVGLGAKAIRGATLGGAIGGTQAASAIPDYSNITGQDISNVAEGTGIGAGLGTLLPVGAAGIGAMTRGALNSIRGGVQGVGNLAREYLTRALMQDDPAAVQGTLARLGPQGMPLDAGPSLQGIGMGIASGQPGEARSALINALTDRNAGTNARLNDVLDTHLGPAQSAQGASDNLQAQRSVLHQQLPRVFAAAPPVDTSGVLSTIGNGLTRAVGPEAAVLTRARNWLMDELPNGQGAIPVQDAERLQNAKMAIDTLIDRGDPTLGVQPGAVSKAQGAIGQVRGQLNQALRQQVPGYAPLMDQSASLARQMEGIEAGKGNVLAGGANPIHPADYATQFQGLPPQEQAAQRLGIRSNIDQAVGTKANDLQAVRQILQGDNGWNAQKMGTAFGQPAADAVSQAADAEAAMRGSYNTITQNSQTAPRQAMVRALQEAAPPQQPLIPGDLRNVTALGGPLELGRKAINGIGGAFRSAPDYVARDLQLGRAVTTQGPERDELIRQLLQAHTNRGQNAAIGQGIGNAFQAIGAVAPNAALSVYQQQNR